MLERLSKQEFILGFLSVLILGLRIGFYVIPLAVLCSVLWACGGTFLKLIRRLGVPASVVVVCSFVLGFHWIYLISIIAGYLALICGDSYPDVSTGDAGSWLGAKIHKLGLTDYWGGLLTKVLVVLILQASWVPILFF